MKTSNKKFTVAAARVSVKNGSARVTKIDRILSMKSGSAGEMMFLSVVEKIVPQLNK